MTHALAALAGEDSLMLTVNRSGYPDYVVDHLADHVVAMSRSRETILRVGLSGLQGSGKSTLARQLKARLEQRACATVAFSLDDFYLTRDERLQLARDVHPLLATRGVPGTHDFRWLAAALEQLASASAERPVAIPRFDKASDDRAGPEHWQMIDSPPQVVLLEGWCVGVSAQTDVALSEPVNALERDEDSDGVWRHWVNTKLCEIYESIWQSLDVLIVLQAPSFDVVTRWRGEVEQVRREHGDAAAMSTDQLSRFVSHYERISRHALATLPAFADHLLHLDADRKVIAMEHSTRLRSPES